MLGNGDEIGYSFKSVVPYFHSFRCCFPSVVVGGGVVALVIFNYSLFIISVQYFSFSFDSSGENGIYTILEFKIWKLEMSKKHKLGLL